MAQPVNVRLFGHPLHALLVAFPIAFLASTPAWDVLAVFTRTHELGRVGYYAELAGLVTAALAALPGFYDLVQLTEGPRLRTGLRHAGMVCLALSWFAVAFALRERSLPPNWWVIALDALGATTLGVAGWFGAELVFGHGVGVRTQAPPGER